MSFQNRLRVSGIPLKYNDKKIRSLLNFGIVIKHLHFSRSPSHPSTSIEVIVAYDSDSDAKYMIWVLDGKEIDGYKIKAKLASSFEIFQHNIELGKIGTKVVTGTTNGRYCL